LNNSTLSENHFRNIDKDSEKVIYDELNQAKKNIISTNRHLISENISQNTANINSTKNFPNFQVNNLSLKKARRQLIKRVSSSGAETNSSENSDSENLKPTNKPDSLLIEDYDWNRTSSSSSKSRNKFKKQSNLGITDRVRSRPLSLSSEKTPRLNSNDLLDPLKQNFQNSVLRTKSLAEQTSDSLLVNGKQNTQIFSSNSHENLNALFSGGGKGLFFLI
jgi:hypothetical protein